MSMTCKSGGSSLADVTQCLKTFAIVRKNGYRYFLPSAPGKRRPDDIKLTDEFKGLHAVARVNRDATAVILEKIKKRYDDIVQGLGIGLNLSREFEIIAERLSRGASLDYAMSRGEYLMGTVAANVLGWTYIDPADSVFIDAKGRIDFVNTAPVLIPAIGRAGGPVVISPFYGRSVETGEIKTLPRGGSDISGSAVAKITRSERYDNLTDRDGMCAADPRIVPDARLIGRTSYRLSREFGLRGVSSEFIFHPEATIPVEDAGIPTWIRNTNNPTAAGTLLTVLDPADQPVLGITGRRECHLIEVSRRAMDDDVGDVGRALYVLARHGIPLRHISTGTESFSIIAYSSDVGTKAEEVECEIKSECEADVVSVSGDTISVLTVVGGGFHGVPGTLARFANALGRSGINVRTTDQGASELSFTFGVPRKDYEDGMRRLYAESCTCH